MIMVVDEMIGGTKDGRGWGKKKRVDGGIDEEKNINRDTDNDEKLRSEERRRRRRRRQLESLF